VRNPIGVADQPAQGADDQQRAQRRDREDHPFARPDHLEEIGRRPVDLRNPEHLLVEPALAIHRDVVLDELHAGRAEIEVLLLIIRADCAEFGHRHALGRLRQFVIVREAAADDRFVGRPVDRAIQQVDVRPDHVRHLADVVEEAPERLARRQP